MSSFFSNPSISLVADASAVINLNATLHANAILRLLPHRFVVTESAVEELQRGKSFGHHDADQFDNLLGLGVACVADLGAQGTSIYETLITGSTRRTLDDGEAATIGHAIELSGIAIIDERKARSICQSDYPTLELVSTADLLLHPVIADGLGPEIQVKSMLNALQLGRMRVPPESLNPVLELIGLERARECPSLPAHVRL